VIPPAKSEPRPSLRHLLGRALDRCGLRPGRDLALRVNELEMAIERYGTESRQRHNALVEGDRPPVLNGSSGHLVVSRYRPVLTHAAIDPARSAQLLELVQSDVGGLLFPAFDRFILPAIRQRGCWEPAESEHLRSKLVPGMRVLDIGANVGYTALVLASAVGDQGLVIALEPEPLNFELLCNNILRNDAINVVPINAAAGERTGSITLQRSPDNTGDHRTAPHPMGIAPLEVPLVAMDDLLPAEQIVDFVFVDAQGYDHRVLRGMEKTIARCQPPMLVEFWPLGILGLGDDPDDVLAQYRSLGYQIELLPNTNVSSQSATEILTHGDNDHVTLSLVPA
jgi:FkbM family methyltransferase